jgi:hypothetical protein
VLHLSWAVLETELDSMQRLAAKGHETAGEVDCHACSLIRGIVADRRPQKAYGGQMHQLLDAEARPLPTWLWGAH